MKQQCAPVFIAWLNIAEDRDTHIAAVRQTKRLTERVIAIVCVSAQRDVFRFVFKWCFCEVLLEIVRLLSADS